MSAKIITVALQKGGSGKSSTAQNTAAILGYKGHKTLLVDFDSQSNASIASGIYEPQLTVSHVLSEECSIKDAITSLALYDVIPSDITLANFDVYSDEIPADLLHQRLMDIREDYEYIVIDSPPSLNNLLKNALCASDFVIVPMQPRPFDIRGIDDLTITLKEVQAKTGRAKIIGILLCRYNKRSVLNKAVEQQAAQIAEELGTSLFDAKIRDSVVVGEAQAAGHPLIEYAPKAAITLDFMFFVGELLGRIS